MATQLIPYYVMLMSPCMLCSGQLLCLVTTLCSSMLGSQCWLACSALYTSQTVVCGYNALGVQEHLIFSDKRLKWRIHCCETTIVCLLSGDCLKFWIHFLWSCNYGLWSYCAWNYEFTTWSLLVALNIADKTVLEVALQCQWRTVEGNSWWLLAAASSNSI